MKTHLDLFSGIGGFAIAAQNCGYKTIGFCEKEPYVQQILKERFGAVLAEAMPSGEWRKSWEEKAKIHADIFALDGADYAGVDLLTGGFPCQPFSVAGKRRGAEDDRALWPEMLRVIDGAKPNWIIGENVAGIVAMELDNILSDLEGIGYTAWPLVIPACAVDARHRRDRVWVVAHSERSASGSRCTERRGAIGAWPRHEFTGSCEDVPDSDGAFSERDKCAVGGKPQRTDSCQPCRWCTEPELGRVAHGIPNRAHRLRGLGNAIVPQVAEEIIRAIESLK